MKRRWRVVFLRAKGEILGQVEAPDVEAAKAAAAVQFDLDEVRPAKDGKSDGRVMRWRKRVRWLRTTG